MQAPSHPAIQSSNHFWQTRPGLAVMKVGIALAPRSEIGNEIAQALLTSGAEPVLLAVDDPATLPQLSTCPHMRGPSV